MCIRDSLYRSMQTSFDQQRKYLHDYKNQLLCIQGLLEEGQTEETLCYVKKLTGGLQQHTNTINTNHNVVNVVLNQKYQYAQKKGIALVMKIGDLSSLNLEEEDIVTLLAVSYTHLDVYKRQIICCNAIFITSSIIVSASGYIRCSDPPARCFLL